MTITTLRNEELPKLVEILRTQADARYDVVAHSSNLSFRDGDLIVRDGDAEISFDGVTSKEVCLEPTDIFTQGLAQRLDIPVKYLRKLRGATDADGNDTGPIALLDANVNEWLARSDKQWFIRGFKGEGEDCGMGRAFLSDRYGCIDNLDVLMAALSGVRAAGATGTVKADLTERRMYVQVTMPEISMLAPNLLKNYRSPFTGATGAENPTVFAGIIISNSETGNGAFTITPRLTVQVCKNGMTIAKDALRKTHLGATMDEGVIRWSDETQRANIELVTAQAKDAVETFCNVDYMRAKIAEIEAAAGVAVAQPTKVIERVSKSLKFSEAEAEGILGHFIQGGDATAGGVMQAVTSFSQTILDPDRANEVEALGLEALALAAA